LIASFSFFVFPLISLAHPLRYCRVHLILYCHLCIEFPPRFSLFQISTSWS
jgi:hypothetical protein